MDSDVKRGKLAIALLSYGFRPFFLLAIWYAVFVIPLWAWLWRTGQSPLHPLPGVLWHAHELVFGLTGAAIAGFLLTAVPSWTGSRAQTGPALLVLALLWLSGRAAFGLGADLPLGVIAALELLFLPVLAALLGPPLLKARNRNVILLVVLLALWISDAVTLMGFQRGDVALARSGILGALNIILLLITVIGGRIVPNFTGNALRGRGLPVSMSAIPWLEKTVIIAMLLVLLADIFAVSNTLIAGIAAAAGLLHLIRLARWYGHRTWDQPIVWILHVGYAWLPVGLLLKALWFGAGVPWAAFWLHALGIGAVATMIVAVMTRAALGHTGRALVTPKPAVVGYGLLIAATLVRVFGGAVADYAVVILLSAVLWSASFALLAAAYTPILVQPRADAA